MNKYHKAFQGFVELFTGAAKKGEKSNPTTIIGVRPNVGNLKINKETFEKALKRNKESKKIFTNPKYKPVDPGLKKALKRNEESKKMFKKAKGNKDGGRIGLKFGGGANMGKKKSNVQKIKETFGPKNVPSKFKGFSKLPEKVQKKINSKLAKKV